MHLLKAARAVPLRAEGRMIKAGRRQDVVEMFLYNDVTGELVGHATGTFVPSGRIVNDLGLVEGVDAVEPSGG
jgi:acyl-coenzyme A thioesterase PaaI-like protein